MSGALGSDTESESTTRNDQLTAEERETFEYLRDNAEAYPNPEFVRGLAEIVLQSDSTREETNS
ncbi:hypothetical protein [Halolamina sp.]|uniref:hypothetical protein n=1 Tax=Halolamina sp. TaxID=1940283 RepID=UPI003564DED0